MYSTIVQWLHSCIPVAPQHTTSLFLYYSINGESENENMRYMGFNMQRTNPGEFYHWHCDEDQLHNKWARSITYIFYLNDIHNDGYTEFYNGLKIQPRQGHCLIFPATWSFVHRGYPPKDETKYIITGWIYSQMVTAVTDVTGATRPHYEDW